MAQLVVKADNGQELAAVSIPNSYVDYIQPLVGGATAKETAANFLTAVIPVLRAHFVGLRVANEDSALAAQREAKKGAAQSEMDTAWPTAEIKG